MFRAGSGDWVVVIGDVCGKGPAAASLTALTRYTVRAAAMHETRPSRVLSILNDAMIEQRDDGRFATVLCAYLTPLTRSVAITCACGGHPLPLVRRADGRVETLGATGTLLGVVPEPALPDSQGELLPGDLLLLYTDGVIEVRRGRKEIFGAEDLVALLERHPDLGPQDLLDRIADEVLEVSGGVLRDDVALLALQARK
jgi:serine phosphatase RsbU (regulator of sigma subunit)